jgi:hypothetical protein
MANLTDIFPAASGNSVLEVVQGICDGRVITVPSGTYTLPNVTAEQIYNTSYSDVTGSSITYTPPENAKYVLYRFDFKWLSQGSSGLSHFRLYMDSTEVIPAYRHCAGQYSGSHSNSHANLPMMVEYVFDLTAVSDDIANGKLAGWTSAKTIKVQARGYTSTYIPAAHGNQWFDGTSATGAREYTKPVLNIIAYS